MIKSWKNALQEYHQKRGGSPPRYETVRIDHNAADQPIWKASLSIFGKEFSGTASDKKSAEAIAAHQAFEFINATPSPEVVLGLIASPSWMGLDPKISQRQKVKDITELDFARYNKILLVDGDNLGFDIKKISPDILILVFVAKNTTRKILFEYQAGYENCYIFISESVGRDAVDFLLTFTAGRLSMLLPNPRQFFVLTRDHYGEYLEKFMKGCKFICSIEEMK